jgi:hypothetical protein
MAVLKAFVGNGNEFAFIAGSAAAFGEPEYGSIPQEVLLTLHNTLNVGLQIFIFMNRHCLFEGPYIEQSRKIILSAKLSVLGRCNQVLQYLALGIGRVIFPPVYAPQAHAGQ